MDDRARRIKGRRRSCPNREHGKRYMVFDLGEGWTCSAPPPHEIDRKRPDHYPDSLAIELRNLPTLDPAGDPT